jgi:hypothetical protein
MNSLYNFSKMVIIMNKEMLKNWAFKRFFGLKDIKTVYHLLKTPKDKETKFDSPNHLSEIVVGHDKQVDSWVEPMAAGTESCPYWDSVRLFHGKEANFDWGEKNMEYWLGIRQTVLAPIIPIPICSYEVVYILGETDKPFRDCMAKYGRARSFYDHAEEFGAKKIFDKTNVYFVESDITYKNDPVWSTCG